MTALDFVAGRLIFSDMTQRRTNLSSLAFFSFNAEREQHASPMGMNCNAPTDICFSFTGTMHDALCGLTLMASHLS